MSIILRTPRDQLPAGRVLPEAIAPHAARDGDAPGPDAASPGLDAPRGHAALAGVLLSAPLTLLALALCVVFRPGITVSVGIVLGTNVGVFGATIVVVALAGLLRQRAGPRP